MKSQKTSLALGIIGISLQLFVLNPSQNKIISKLNLLENKLNSLENKLNSLENNSVPKSQSINNGIIME